MQGLKAQEQSSIKDPQEASDKVAFFERFSDWPIDLRIKGRLIVASSLEDTSTIWELLSNSSKDGKALLLCRHHESKELLAEYQNYFAEAELLGSLLDRDAIESAEVIAWHTSKNFRPQHQYLDRHAAVFEQVLSQGKTIIVVGGAAAWCSEKFISNEKPHPEIESGIGLIPDSILETEFTDSDLPRVLSALASHPGKVGIGIDPNTALLLSGRKMIVSGSGGATLLLASDGRAPYKRERIIPRTGERSQRPTEFLADLTQWRREAIDRTLETFPPAEREKPCVPNGTLFIVGGGGMPEGLLAQFVEAAGGDEARLVYVPCSERDEVGDRHSIVSAWERMGVASATYIHTKDRTKANEDESFFAPLKEATGIWFGGGRQWNFSDSYYGTQTHRLMKEVLNRGGVIGGSSAGASIQASYLCRATPIENFLPMAPGYERGGLGFIAGVAIDQHFSQRGRQKDMTSLVNRYPQLLGIGIDEATAIIVRGSEATVTGRGQVFFYDRSKDIFPDKPDYEAYPAGSVYDLDRRELISQPD